MSSKDSTLWTQSPSTEDFHTRRSSSSSSSSHGRSNSAAGLPALNVNGRPVVCIKAVGTNAEKEDAGENKLLSGDIVEKVINSYGLELKAPFAGGVSGLHKEIRNLYFVGQKRLLVCVKRGGGRISAIEATIVKRDSNLLRKVYALEAPNDPSHVVMFAEAREEECLTLQDKRHERMISKLTHILIKDEMIPYPWQQKMRQVQPVGGDITVYSVLVLPQACDNAGMPHYGNVQDTVTRATIWLSASQASGAPLTFLSIQTEPLLTKISGQQAASTRIASSSSMRGDLSHIANAGIYGFEDYHGIDIGVVRAIRLWFAPSFGEVTVQLKVEDGETMLGVGIGRTAEGFCYVSTVGAGTAADRAGLRVLLTAAQAAHKILVVTKVGDAEVMPWCLSATGSIRTFDTSSISQKLSAQRMAGKRACLCLMAVEGIRNTVTAGEESGSRATLSSVSEHDVSNYFD